MEWLTQIGLSLSGLPWWAAAIIAFFTVLATKGVDALLKLRKSHLEVRQYEDGQTKAGYEALVAELKRRVEKLEGIVETSGKALDEARTAHAKCEIEQEKLRGQINVMEVRLQRLEVHDVAQKRQVETLKAALIEEVPKVEPPKTA